VGSLARSKKLQEKPLKVELADLEHMPLPIVFVNMNIYKIAEKTSKIISR
jgi:hypothetical protein